jgi:hypothetical protein
MAENGETFPEDVARRFFEGPSTPKSIDAAERAPTSPELDKPETLYAEWRR